VGSVAAFVVFILIGFVIIFLTYRSDGKAIWKSHFLARYIEYVFLAIFAVRIEIEGKENIPTHHRFVIYSNHIEFTDPIYIKYVFRDHPIAFVSKDSLFKVPFIRQILLFMGGIPLSRKVGDRTALDSINTAIRAVENGQPIAIYPEGTRSHANVINPFRAGSFRIVLRAKATLVPITMFDVQKSRFRLRIKPVTIKMAILPPIEPSELETLDTVDLSNLVFARLRKKMDEYLEASGQPAAAK
jgi:1-acyl-sn-glycerol-3-phosphate acyltransferase